MRKERFIGAACFTALAGVGLFLRSRYEREQISVEPVVIETDKIGKKCTMVFLSDLHDHQFGAGNRRLIKAIHQVNPDLVLIGGDMMVTRGKADTTVSLNLIRELVKRYPVYYGNGNHETRMRRERHIYGRQYQEYVKQLQRLGVMVLSDRTEYFRSDIAITGMDLEERFYLNFKPDHLHAEEITEKIGTPEQNRFHILLSHSPLYFDAYKKWGADLTLAGHFHGGTIRIPFLGGLMTPQFQFFLPWCAGTFHKGDSHMIVSRGLGTHSVNIRLNNKPQLVVVKLCGKSSAKL